MNNYKFIKYKNFITFLILALIALFVYLPSRSYHFQFDDLPNILNYTKLKSETFWSLFFTHSRWLITYLNCLIYQFCGSEPTVCRLINIAIHITNGALIFWLCLQFKHHFIKNNFFLATLTCLFFLLHPVQSQTVSYVIQGQLEGLSSLFMLLAIASLIYYNRAKQFKIRMFGLILIFSFLLLATSTKEIAIITPILLLLFDWFWLSPNYLQIKTKLKLYLGLFAATCAIYLYYLKPVFFLNLITGNQTIQFNTGNLLSSTGQIALNQYQFLISQFKVICHYLQIFIWPFNICVEYDWQLCTSFWDLSCFGPFLILLSLGLIILFLLKKDLRHPIAFGLIWFLMCILPRASLIASGELLVDYKTYLASFGLLFVFAYLITLIINQTSLKRKLFMLVTCASLLSYLTYQRNLVWSNSCNFWHDVIIKAPQKARGLNNYGMALLETGKTEQAIYYFKQALKLNSQNKIENFYWDAYQNLASAYALTGQINLAIATIEQALAINPQNAELQNNLGALLLHQQDYVNSIKHLEIALLLKPNNGQALYNLGRAYFALNNISQAWFYLDQACHKTHMDRIEPVLELYCETCIKLQKLDSAIWSLKKLLKINPQNIQAWLNLAGAYYFKQDYLASQDCYQQILLFDPNNQAAQDKLRHLSNIPKIPQARLLLPNPNIS